MVVFSVLFVRLWGAHHGWSSLDMSTLSYYLLGSIGFLSVIRACLPLNIWRGLLNYLLCLRFLSLCLLLERSDWNRNIDSCDLPSLPCLDGSLYGNLHLGDHLSKIWIWLNNSWIRMEQKFCPYFFLSLSMLFPALFSCYNRAMNDIELKDGERVNQLFSSDVKIIQNREVF